jgi:hypothetical protein
LKTQGVFAKSSKIKTYERLFGIAQDFSEAQSEFPFSSAEEPKSTDLNLTLLVDRDTFETRRILS